MTPEEVCVYAKVSPNMYKTMESRGTVPGNLKTENFLKILEILSMDVLPKYRILKIEEPVDK